MALSVICKQISVTGQDRVKKRRTGLHDSRSGVCHIAAKNTVEGPRRKFQANNFNNPVIK